MRSSVAECFVELRNKSETTNHVAMLVTFESRSRAAIETIYRTHVDRQDVFAIGTVRHTLKCVELIGRSVAGHQVPRRIVTATTFRSAVETVGYEIVSIQGIIRFARLTRVHKCQRRYRGQITFDSSAFDAFIRNLRFVRLTVLAVYQTRGVVASYPIERRMIRCTARQIARLLMFEARAVVDATVDRMYTCTIDRECFFDIAHFDATKCGRNKQS